MKRVKPCGEDEDGDPIYECPGCKVKLPLDDWDFLGAKHGDNLICPDCGEEFRSVSVWAVKKPQPKLF